MWRVGRKLGRTIYEQLGDEPGDGDVLIGIMDTAGYARIVVAAVNELLRKETVNTVDDGNGLPDVLKRKVRTPSDE